MVQVCSLVLLATAASASFVSNLNYRSPSHFHPGLGVSIRKVAARNTPSAAWNSSQLNFTHGVASGDPYDTSVILWTRAAPILSDNDKSNIAVTGYVPLYSHETEHYKVSTDAELNHCVDEGKHIRLQISISVKFEARNLQSFTRYYYQFNICNSNNSSLVGRTKTTPRKRDVTNSAVRFAIYSCSNFPFGFFNAYGNTARKDSVDYVIHLGDYIYEYANGEYGWGNSIDRIPLPDREICTLYDYRKRLATYRTDLDLLLSHQQFPWTPMNAVRAYFEWMPIRQVEMDYNLRIWRSFEIGDLLDLIMLDTRQYDRSITDLYWNTDYIHSISNDAGRTLMGSRQENWFYNQRSESSNESFALGNANLLNYDAWDGYQSNKNRTLSHLYDNKINNTIFLTGDSHASWVSDLVWLDTHPYDPKTGEGSIGVEFAGSAVSSPCSYGQNITLSKGANSELQWQDLSYRGYYELSFDKESANASCFGLPTIATRNGYEISLANFTVMSGANKLMRTNGVVGRGVAESGSMKFGTITGTNITNNTATGSYFISSFTLIRRKVFNRGDRKRESMHTRRSASSRVPAITYLKDPRDLTASLKVGEVNLRVLEMRQGQAVSRTPVNPAAPLDRKSF
ncbi:phosphodiesterase/alkaline phosphatase D precursor [Rhexocercosporidium sp. MPI-PUGE-AT-0058]|nr:phosphodiesterase/alkaline phosphatase D precursor [Rhexocercosporidium sp. MPI-PUGE-AT-0058]